MTSVPTLSFIVMFKFCISSLVFKDCFHIRSLLSGELRCLLTTYVLILPRKQNFALSANFLQYSGDNLHEMSSPVFLEKYMQYNILSAELVQRGTKVQLHK